MGLGCLWALRGQCCVGGICDSKIKEIWWFTTKICPTLRVPIGVLNSPRGITIHIYKFACLDRLVQITTNQMTFLRNLMRIKRKQKEKDKNTSNSVRGITIHIYKLCVFGPPRPNHNNPNEIRKKSNENQGNKRNKKENTSNSQSALS